MEARILTVEETKTYVKQISEDSDVCYIKLIGFGKQFMAKIKEDGEELDKTLEKSGGFVLLCQREELREELHSIVDRFCNEKERVDNE
jgi:hypothetical protein